MNTTAAVAAAFAGPVTVLRTLIGALCLVASAAAMAATPSPPQTEFADLFAAVQSAALFPDSKTFADALPLSSPTAILGQYHAQRPRTPADLRAFVDRNFEVPDATALPGLAQSSAPPLPLGAHIDALWPQLERRSPTVPRYSSALSLPKPYVVPGGRFRELYYWDSYFTMLGLAQSGRQELVQDMIDDFGWLIDRYGHIPNGTRSYYLGRSQPPFFFEMVALSQPQDPAAAWARYLPQLRREYAYWMIGATQLHGTWRAASRSELAGWCRVEPQLGRCRSATR